MKEIKLNCGVTVKIDSSVFDDMEMIEDIAAADENVLLVPKLVTKILGAEQKKTLYNALRDEHGRVPVEKTINVITELFMGMGEDGKN